MKLILVAGARPNFMKVAPIVEELAQRNPEIDAAGETLELRLVHTGQHYDGRMSQAFFDDLGLPRPDINLEIGSGSHAEQTARVMLAFEGVLLGERPDLVVVVGDVNSTLACALTARKLGIRVAHVEAGLRSRDMTMPEEINRRVTDTLSDYLFITEPTAYNNLVREDIDPRRIFFVGNVMIDTLQKQLRRIEQNRLHLPVSTGFKQRFPRYGILTLHRPSNVDNVAVLKPLLELLHDISQELPLLFPIHPRTAGKIREYGLAHLLRPFEIGLKIEAQGSKLEAQSSRLKDRGSKRMAEKGDSSTIKVKAGLVALLSPAEGPGDPGKAEKGNSDTIEPGEMGVRCGGLYTTEPLGYLEMLNLSRHARLVLTDSGGLQEETTALRVPCLTLRENTERPITLEVGTNVLVGTDPERIQEEVWRALSVEGPRGRIPEKWDGRAARRIVEVILERERVLGEGARE